MSSCRCYKVRFIFTNGQFNYFVVNKEIDESPIIIDGQRKSHVSASGCWHIVNILTFMDLIKRIVTLL